MSSRWHSSRLGELRHRFLRTLVLASAALAASCTDEPQSSDGAGAGGVGGLDAGHAGGADVSNTDGGPASEGGQGIIVGSGGSDGGSGQGMDGGGTEGPACGDGLLNQTEERCDDKNRASGDGCSSECRVEADYLCATPGQPCTTTKVCGDGRIVGDETCDDGGSKSGDGCSATCTREQGFVCPLPGAPCVEICGDALVVGRETCDDHNAIDGDGCSSACQVELDAAMGANGRPAYWTCPTPGALCVRATCGNGKEGAEPCDDGNDRPGDGCSPDCRVEPQCTASGCVSRCGDGIILPGETEQCDDGNSLNGDGCSATCTKELGYTCQQVTGSLPTQLMIPIVYRDFVGAQRARTGAPTHPDFESTRGGASGTPGLVKSTLNSSGVPELTGLCVGSPVNGLLTGATGTACPSGTLYGSATTYRFNQMSGEQAFAQWFKDVPATNRTIVSRLCLARQGTTDSYVFDSSAQNPTDCGPAANCADGQCWFLPINDKGFVAAGLEVDNLGTPDVIFGSADPANLKGNFSFTSVVRTWFIYRGGEQLAFSGDDDVWVFINGQLAVDLGGLHGIAAGGVTLDSARATQLGLTSGRVYEMVLFHAERYGYGSNFKLTLTGFLTAKSQCASVCGDGIRVGQEACDNGEQNVAAGPANTYGRCTNACQLGPRCGDGLVQLDAGEECDEPSAQMVYTDTPRTGCTPACKRPGYCGDGVLQTGVEECDDGSMNSTDPNGYGKCTNTCRLGPHCGDGIKSSNEQCDEGDQNGQGACSLGCQLPVVY